MNAIDRLRGIAGHPHVARFEPLMVADARWLIEHIDALEAAVRDRCEALVAVKERAALVLVPVLLTKPEEAT